LSTPGGPGVLACLFTVPRGAWIAAPSPGRRRTQHIEGSALNRFRLAQTATPALALSVALLASLTACGGGVSSEPAAADANANAVSANAPGSAAESLDSAVAAAMAGTEVQPAYHMAPALLDEPSQVDAGGTNASARQAARSFNVDASIADIDTARLSRDTLKQRIADSARARIASASGGTTAPLAIAIVGAVHTPAQIRAAYGLAALPVAGAALTATQAAALGAGQTIYLVDAYHDATALSDLNAFSTKFGLPTCTNVAIATTAALPLATPPSSCTFSAVNSTTTAAMSTVVPAYNATWAPESKLDVQWAHAIAPLARIVLIEMPNSLSTSILGSTLLATKLGKGVVSMSFGSAEAAWTSSVDSYFAGAGMTYVAAAGDSGTQVLWPAVSANVVAVGGTSLNWSGSGTRYEAAWTSGGGGMSAYVALPAWQSGVTPIGGSALVRRAVPDVAFNANPMTGEYVALTLPGRATVWSAYGGTSIAAPQWAGVIAVANAIRVANAKAVLGDIHATLYKSIAAVPGTYAASLGDVVDGTNGTCATCRAGAGFDQATGWGTPNAAGLLTALTGTTVATSSVPATAPTVPGGSFATKAGTTLSQSLNVTAPSGTTTSYALTSAPSGLTVDATGTLKWATPVVGSYSFTATASTAAGKSASAAYALKVIAATAPVFSSGGKFSGTTGTTFSGVLSATNPNVSTLAYSLTGAPSGLAVTTAGALAWATPVAGSYTFTAKVTDSYGYAATQTETLTIAAAPVASGNHAPTLTAMSWSGTAGATFSTMLVGHDADGDSLSYTFTGVPVGMKLMASGFLYWVTPVKGSYAFTVTVRDSKGAAAAVAMKLIVS
jgi:subtilase family serine protease